MILLLVLDEKLSVRSRRFGTKELDLLMASMLMHIHAEFGCVVLVSVFMQVQSFFVVSCCQLSRSLLIKPRVTGKETLYPFS